MISILMLLISYTTLKKTLESKILRDRQTFVQLVGHLVDEDLASISPHRYIMFNICARKLKSLSNESAPCPPPADEERDDFD